MQLQRETKTPKEWRKVTYIQFAPALFIAVSVGMIVLFQRLVFNIVLSPAPTGNTMGSVFVEGMFSSFALVGGEMITTILIMGILEVVQYNHKQYLNNKHHSRI